MPIVNGVARAAGHPNYSSGSSIGFIPQIWSSKLIEKLYLTTVFAAITNTYYEGEIKSQGDTVIIRQSPNLTIRDYQIGQDLEYEKPGSEKIEFQIDKAKYFAFQLNDVDRHQSDLKLMEDWSKDAAQQMKIAIDTSILHTVFADAAAQNGGNNAGAISGNISLGAAGAPVAVTRDNVLDVIIDTSQALDEQNTPDEGRYLVIPAWMSAMLKKSDLRDASIMGDGTSAFRNGRLGMLDRYEVYVSNNLAKTNDGGTAVTNMIFGHKKALTFAAQMTQMDHIPNQKDFGELVRGLNVYGFKVIDPLRFGHLYAYKG